MLHTLGEQKLWVTGRSDTHRAPASSEPAGAAQGAVPRGGVCLESPLRVVLLPFIREGADHPTIVYLIAKELGKQWRNVLS